MRYFFRRYIPKFERILLVESGSRYLADALLPGLEKLYPDMQLDLVTCFAGLPKGFREDRGRVWRVTDYQGRSARSRLYAEIASRRHTICGIICTGEPIMTKWKWILAARSSGKVFILNENGDYFWLDYSNWTTIRHFILFRTGLAGAGAARTLLRLVLLPFTLAYLLLYAATLHLRRRWNS